MAELTAYVLCAAAILRINRAGHSGFRKGPDTAIDFKALLLAILIPPYYLAKLASGVSLKSALGPIMLLGGHGACLIPI